MDDSLKLVETSSFEEDGAKKIESDYSLQFLKRYVQNLQEDNEKMRSTLDYLNLLNNSPEIEKSLEKLKFLQINSDAKECSIEAIALAIAEKQRKSHNYLSKLKMYSNMFSNLNDKITKELASTETELQKAHNKINQLKVLPEADLVNLESKAKLLENELKKLEKKKINPKLSLFNIKKECDELEALVYEKSCLEDELAEYQGLPPDIVEARKKLKEMKLRYQEMKNCLQI